MKILFSKYFAALQGLSLDAIQKNFLDVFGHFEFFLDADFENDLECTLVKKYIYFLMSFDCFKNFLEFRMKFSTMIFDNLFENAFEKG